MPIFDLLAKEQRNRGILWKSVLLKRLILRRISLFLLRSLF